MRLVLKDSSVNFNGLTMPTILAILKAMDVYERNGLSTLTITSANDGEHKDTSKHYSGDALDLRIRGTGDPLTIRNQLQDELGDDYDVILEPDHIHIEYDPRP